MRDCHDAALTHVSDTTQCRAILLEELPAFNKMVLGLWTILLNEAVALLVAVICEDEICIYPQFLKYYPLWSCPATKATDPSFAKLLTTCLSIWLHWLQDIMLPIVVEFATI